MTYVSWKLEHFNDLEGTGTPDNEITRFRNPQIITSMGDGRDSFSFTIKLNSDAADFLNIRDKVRIKRTIEGASPTTSDIIMVGAVNKLPKSRESNKSVIKVKGNNFSKTLMDAVVFTDASDKTIPNALEEALNSIKNYSQGFGVSWNNNNPDKKRDGTTDFPTVDEKWYYKSMRKILSDYSNDAETDDGDYYWYVDTDNTLVWRPEEDTSVDVINDSTKYKNIKLKRDSEEVVNFVRAKGDTLPTGGAVEAQYIDFGSAGKHGLRFKTIQSDAKTTSTNHNQVMANIGASEEDVLPSDVSGFSYPLSNSDIPWEESATIDSDAKYLQELKAFVKSKLRARAEEHVTNNRNGYYEVDIDVLAKNNTFNLGEVYDINIDGLFPDDNVSKPMRVKEIQYTNNVDNIVLREDTPSV